MLPPRAEGPLGSGPALWLSAALLGSLGVGPCAAVRLSGRPSPGSYGLNCTHFSWDNIPDYVTAIISTSPRREDASGKGLEVLKETVKSAFHVLGLKKVIVAFDALPDERKEAHVEDLSSSVAHHYVAKRRGFEAFSREELGGAATIFENKEWTHQAEMLHRVLEHLQEAGQLTPIIYLAQDDSPVLGDIDVPLIVSSLSCDRKVDNVRFLWSNDCDANPAPHWNTPCTQHPRTPLLHQVSRYSDRPNFGTTEFLLNEVFGKIKRSYRGGPERSVRGIDRAWVYGLRHHMLHERNLLADSYNEWSGLKPGKKR